MWGGTLSGRPASAAAPTAIMEPEISPPGRLAHKNSVPPAAPVASVSSTLRVLARLGMASAIAARIWLTPPYGKSVDRGQMRQRDAAMRVEKSKAWKSQNKLAARLADTCANREGTNRRPNRGNAPSSSLRGRMGNDRVRSLLFRCGLLAFGTEFLALLA